MLADARCAFRLMSGIQGWSGLPGRRSLYVSACPARLSSYPKDAPYLRAACCDAKSHRQSSHMIGDRVGLVDLQLSPSPKTRLPSRD